MNILPDAGILKLRFGRLEKKKNAGGQMDEFVRADLPEESGDIPMDLGGLLIVMTHAAIVARGALVRPQQTVERKSSRHRGRRLRRREQFDRNQDRTSAVGPTMQQAEAAQTEPPKVEEKQPEPVVKTPPRTERSPLPDGRTEVEETETSPLSTRDRDRAPPKSDRIGTVSKPARTRTTHGGSVICINQSYQSAAHGKVAPSW